MNGKYSSNFASNKSIPKFTRKVNRLSQTYKCKIFGQIFNAEESCLQKIEVELNQN